MATTSAAIKILIEKLNKRPEIKFEVKDNSLTVPPQDANGFSVSILSQHDKHFTVSYDLWHEEFENAEDALNCFTLGLSDKCRLKVIMRGTNKFKWTLEYYKNNSWIGDSTMGKFNFEFWKPVKIEYLQNNFLNE